MGPSNYRFTDVDGTVYDIDQRFGLRRVADTDGHTLTFSRHGVEHSSGSRIAFTRDSQGRITRITDPLGHPTRWTYNAHGRVLTQTDALDQVVTQDYDPADYRLLNVTNADDYSFQREYDDGNKLAALIDPLGQATRYAYDLNDRLIRQTDPLGAVTTYRYDANGRKLSETLTRTDETGTPVEQTQR